MSTGKPTDYKGRNLAMKTTNDYYTLLALRDIIASAQKKKHAEGKHSKGLQRALEHIGKRLKEEG